MEFKLNKEMRRLIEGDYVGLLCANIGKEVLKESLGSGKIMEKHLRTRQGKWPKLAASTKRDKRKRNPKIFVNTGQTAKALATTPNDGKLRKWTSTGPGGVVRRRRFRYTANGVWAVADVDSQSVEIAVGFSGRLDHSAAVKKAREKIAAERGAKLSGLTRKKKTSLVRKMVTVDEAVAAAKASGGKGTRKFGQQRKNNLAHGTVVQIGKFGGIRNKKGRVFSAQEAARGISAAKLKGGFSVVRKGKARPLLPYDGGDTAALSRALERAVEVTLREISG